MDQSQEAVVAEETQGQPEESQVDQSPSPSSAETRPMPDRNAPHNVLAASMGDGGGQILRAYPPQDRQIQPGESMDCVRETYEVREDKLVLANLELGRYTPAHTVRDTVDF